MSEQPASLQQNEDKAVENRFTAYVITAIRNQKIMYSMKNAKDIRFLQSLDEMLDHGLHPQPLVVGFEEYEQMLDGKSALESVICNDKLLIAILKLSDRERRILNLHLIHKMKHGEIADLLGLRQNTVEKAYSRLIGKLRGHMRGEGDG
jgi:RNA polymerase sigma factor (sigma-70 family)